MLRRKISTEDAQAILDARPPRNKGKPMFNIGVADELAAKHGITAHTIHKIWRRATWSHLRHKDQPPA